MAESTTSELRPARQDFALAGLMIAIGLADVWLATDLDRFGGSLGAIVMGGAMAWRRLAPLAVMTVTALAEVVLTAIWIPVDGWVFILLVLVIGMYSLGAYSPSLPRSLVGVLAVMVAMTASVYVNDGPGAENLGFAGVLVGAPWIAGVLVRRRTEEALELEHRAAELVRRGEEQRRRAIAEERARIARELHDIIAHSVSVMTVQAGAIEEVVERDRAAAMEAAAAIRETGRQALADLRSLLGLLREDGNGTDRLDPQPGLDDLAGLVEQVRAAGLAVELTIDGQGRPLPPAVGLSAYRVVQEALTNTLKHADASRADVTIRLLDECVDIEVTDDGGVRSPAPGANGHGLIGMRERMALHGGQLDYGVRPSGGFRVHAVLPTSTEAP